VLKNINDEIKSYLCENCNKTILSEIFDIDFVNIVNDNTIKECLKCGHLNTHKEISTVIYE